MIEKLKLLIATTGGKVVAALLSVVLICSSVYAFRQYLKGDTPDDAFYSTYVCSETGKSFRHRNELGETTPILSPYSGKNTGYPAEACYWTADGHVKKDPTWVLLNSQIGKPEPTFCPDCGRLVVGHNPDAVEGHRPPPTREEWFAAHQR
jgi:hypothetical protein